MKTARQNDFRRLPKTYSALVKILPPRPIRGKTDLANATKMIDRMAGFDLNADQENYLDVLSTFVEIYEMIHYPIDDGK